MTDIPTTHEAASAIQEAVAVASPGGAVARLGTAFLDEALADLRPEDILSFRAVPDFQALGNNPIRSSGMRSSA